MRVGGPQLSQAAAGGLVDDAAVWKMPAADGPVVVHGSGAKRLCKRAFDVVGAGGLLVASAPLMAAVGTAVALTSHGPVLYRHTRVGEHGELFACIKFRTMVVDADARLADLLAEDPVLAAQYRDDHKLRRDPRATPIGRILRISSLDELPQLINVLRGEMSLVGPRPVMPHELNDRYGQLAAQLLTVAPGLTGPWQVSGRNNLSYDERVRLDLSYSTEWTLWEDLRLLGRTMKVLLRPKENGAR